MRRSTGALVPAGGVCPGSRGVVRFSEDPGWDHERVFLVRTGEASWIVYTPGNDMYEESFGDYERLRMSRARRFPADAGQVVSFSRALEADEIRELVVAARVEAAALLGEPASEIDVSGAVDWHGRALAIPPPSAVGAPNRRRLRGKQGTLAIADAVGGTATPVLLDPEPGHLWLVSELGPDFGKEVTLGEGSVRVRDRGIYANPRGVAMAVEMVKGVDAGEWRRRRVAAVEDLAQPRGGTPEGLGERLFGGRLDPGAGPGSKRGDGGSDPVKADDCGPGPTEEDLRTCWIDYDESGVRYKEWRKVVLESSQENFRDAPIRGPPTCLAICRKMQDHGGNPKPQFAEEANIGPRLA